MADEHVSDERLAQVLGVYAGMVGRVLASPERWLGLDDDPPPSARWPVRALDAARDRAFGEQTPASPTWTQVAVDDRVNWWVRRIGISAGLAAAAPRFFGAVADRLPVQAALGAAAAGLAVCATAHERGRTSPEEWVPLLAKVLFDRDLEAVPVAVPDEEASERNLEQSDGTEAAAAAGPVGRLTGGGRRAAGTLWRLTRALLETQNMLGRRPRGGRLVRAIGKVPVVGVASGWLDERSGIRKAAQETAALLDG